MKLIHTLEGGGVMWWCPACGHGHGGPGWHQVGDALTIAPSARVIKLDGTQCHSTVADGVIHFEEDCTNGWANMKVPLEGF